MNQALALPTRKSEDYRYADLGALAQVWPIAPEQILLEAGQEGTHAIVHTGNETVARDLEIRLGAGAKFALHLLDAGMSYGRVAVRVTLGAGAEFTFGAAQLAGSGQTLEIITDVSHAGPDAVSRQIVRSVAANKSTVNYLGKVHVARGADGTDGEQSVRAMLLDRTAAANARPELEIYADDVKCAHGCAVGELDAQALFYMAQRGLPPHEAKKLMLQAFVAEAFVGAEAEERLLGDALDALGRLV